MAININDLGNKKENNGANKDGQLAAEEWNRFVQAVIETQNPVKTVSVNNGAKFVPDEYGNVNVIITESNYILNVTGEVNGSAPFKVALGSSFPMKVTISNKYLDNDVQVSVPSSCKVDFYCNDLVVYSTDAYDGDSVIYDFGKDLQEGKNYIKAVVDNNNGVIKETLNYEINAIYLALELPYFDKTEIQSAEWELAVKVVGSNANIFINIDGEGGLVGGQTAGSTVNYPITKGLITGYHTIEVYAVSEEDSSVRTDSIFSEYIFVVEGTTTTVIASAVKNRTQFKLYNVLNVEYWISKTGEEGILPITVAIIDDSSNPIVSTTQQVQFTNGKSGLRNVEFSLFNETLIGERILRITCGDTTRDIQVIINPNEVSLTEIKGYDLYLSSAGRSNNETNYDNWSYGTYKVTFPEGFEFSSAGSGWNADKDGNVALNVKKGRKISINYTPFIDNPAFGNDIDVLGTKRGATLSFEIATRNCVKRDASVVRCVYNGIGFEFLANSMYFASNNERMQVDYKEDVRVRIDLVIEGSPITYMYDDNGTTKTSDEARMIVYVDGVYQQMRLLTNVTSFKQDVAQEIEIGSDFCDVDVYCIRAYRSVVDMKGIVDNYAFDTPKVEDKIKIAKRNDIFDSKLNVNYQKLLSARPELPIMLVGMETLPNSKTKIPVATTIFTNPNNEGDYYAGASSFTSANDEMGNQGTSSMNYPMPYRNMDWKTLSKRFTIGGQNFEKYPMYRDMPPIGKFTFKKDYASSEMANNIVTSMAFNQMAIGLKDAFSECLSPAQKIDFNKYRLSLYGIPMFMFKYWNNEYTPMGMFNFIQNKNEVEYLGFAKSLGYVWDTSKGLRAQSWEIRDNNIFWDFALNEAYWDDEANKEVNDVFTYYEARYPKESPTNENNDFGHASIKAEIETAKDQTRDLLRLHNWLVDTNQDLATGAKLTEAYVDINGNEYLYDNRAYRLAKFQTEWQSYIMLDQWILYYIWREQFWMYDSGSKNLQLYTMDGNIWGCMVRDADTGLGIDNEGKFMFPPYLEDTDFIKNGEFVFNQTSKPEGASTVLNGQLGSIWINIRDGYKDKIQQMYVALYDNAGNTKFNYNYMIDWFEKHQGNWSEALYNFGSKQYYGGAPYSKWIDSGLGDKKNQRRYWLYYGFRYRASKYHAGSGTNRITWRQYGVGCDLNIKTYSEMYVALGFGTYEYATTTRYRCLDLENGVIVKNELKDNVSDTVMYLFNGDMITDLGNLYEFGNIKSLDLTNASRLRFLRMGNHLSKDRYINTNEEALDQSIGNCVALEYLDLTNLKALSKYLTLTNLINLKELYLYGSAVTGVTLPETSALTTIEFGKEMESVRLINLTSLNKLTFEGYSKIKSVIIRNCPNIDSYNIVRACYGNEGFRELRVEGIDWTISDVSMLEVFANMNRENLDVRGRIKVIGGTINFKLKRALVEQFGNVDDPNNPLYIYGYVQNELKSFTVEGLTYYQKVGEYQIPIIPNLVNVNDITNIHWEISSVNNATIDVNGMLSVHTIGDKARPYDNMATITATITKIDGTTLTNSKEVSFYERDAQVGDYVYADGSWSDVFEKDKTVIGICYYIDAEDKNKRLCVSNLAQSNYSPNGLLWGLNTTSVSGVTLNNPPTQNFDVYRVFPEKELVYTNISTVTYIDSDNNFIIFDPKNTTGIGEIGFKELTTSDISMIGDYLEEYEKVEGYKISWARYNTLRIIYHRDLILSDSAIVDGDGNQLAIPKSTIEKSELTHLKELVAHVIATPPSTSVTANNYRAFYFEKTSYIYAFDIRDVKGYLKDNEFVSDKFLPHKWSHICLGDAIRIAWYQALGYSEKPDANGVNKPIFANAYSNGVYNSLQTSMGTTSTEQGQDVVRSQWTTSITDKTVGSRRENKTAVNIPQIMVCEF